MNRKEAFDTLYWHPDYKPMIDSLTPSARVYATATLMMTDFMTAEKFSEMIDLLVTTQNDAIWNDETRKTLHKILSLSNEIAMRYKEL